MRERHIIRTTIVSLGVAALLGSMEMGFGLGFGNWSAGTSFLIGINGYGHLYHCG
jgi:hypothetical protein